MRLPFLATKCEASCIKYFAQFDADIHVMPKLIIKSVFSIHSCKSVPDSIYVLVEICTFAFSCHEILVILHKYFPQSDANIKHICIAEVDNKTCIQYFDFRVA